MSVEGLAKGPVRVEFWDTLRGAKIKEATATPTNGTIRVDVPAFTRDIAFKLKRPPAAAASPAATVPTAKR